MAKDERVRKAFNAARNVGISSQEIKSWLKQLLEAFENNWEPIEADSYRLLIDGYFQSKENTNVDDEGNVIMEGGGSTRPSKKLHLPEVEDQASCTIGSSCQEVMDLNKKDSSSSGCSNSSKMVKYAAVKCNKNLSVHIITDITKGTENLKISLVGETGDEDLPRFTYMRENQISENAYVQISLARIADEQCCLGCSGDCLLMPIPCACARETNGEFAYTPEGLVKEEFLNACISMNEQPLERHLVYCQQDCPLERYTNEDMPEKCKGHLIRKFIKECWIKCGCNKHCGNRVVQRGITCNLQVFLTHEGKGWGLRTLEDLPKGAFVCEYVGEILTNTELYQRNMKNGGTERHTYPVTLDADWGSEKALRDEEALCLDATFYGNVARFINHRCSDANLIDIPVEIETPDRHYYHLAFFTKREVKAQEELTWDYGIDFDDHNHPIKAFKCSCGSPFCRDAKRKGKKRAFSSGSR